MLSFVSVLSVNLIATIATPRSDSLKVSALDSGAVAVFARRVSSAGSLETRAELERHLLVTASRYLGTRYRFGGTRPSAFDCSGFVRYVFARHGVALPRTAREQSSIGTALVVGVDSLRAGDLLFFRTPRGQASHVAMYVGDGRIIHASSGSHRVRYDDLGSARGRWFVEHLTSIRRVTG